MHKIEISQYKNFNLAWQPEYTDQDLTAAANQGIIKTVTLWRKHNAPIAIGDTITVLNRAILDGIIIPELTSSSLTYTVGDKTILEHLNQAVGKKLGDIFDIVVKFPANASVERIQNQEVTFHIEIKDVKHTASVSITDELINQIDSQYSSLEAMQTAYKNLIAENAFDKAREEVYQKIIELIIANSSYELDPEIYADTISNLKNQEQAIKDAYEISQGFNPEHNLAKHYQECETKAKKQILENIILTEIAKLEEITISESEFIENKRAFTQSSQDLEQFQNIFPTDQHFKDFLLKEKIIENLINWNTLN